MPVVAPAAPSPAYTGSLAVAVAPAVASSTALGAAPAAPRAALPIDAGEVEQPELHVAEVIARYGGTVLDVQHVGQVRSRRSQAPAFLALGGLMLLAGVGIVANDVSQDWEGHQEASAQAQAAGRPAPQAPGLGLGGLGMGLALLGLVPFGLGVVRRSDVGLDRYTVGEGHDATFHAAADTPVTLVGRDPARLYLHACPGARPRAHQYADGTWRPLRLPDTTCVRALAEAPDGALWLVSAGGLYRHPAPAPVQGVAAAWEKLTLPAVPLPARPAAWRHNGDMFEWNEFPAVPAAAPTPEPDQVVVLASGELWLAASVGASRFGFAARGRSVVLTTRPVAAAVVLPDPMLLAAEASLLDEPAVGPASDCRTLHLQLGATSDAPASARPPALTDDRLGDLRVVTTAVGTRHDLAVLWLRGAPEPADAHTRLAALVEPLRPSYPALRLRCSLPTITGLLP